MITIGIKDGLFVPPTTPGATICTISSVDPNHTEVDFVEQLALGLMNLYKYSTNRFKDIESQLKQHVDQTHDSTCSSEPTANPQRTYNDDVNMKGGVQ